jgi:hypothetical protein
MIDAPVLMKNTETGGYFLYVEKTVKAMTNLIPIFEAQVTPEMEELAGLNIGHFSKVDEPEVVPAPEKKEVPTPPDLPAPVATRPDVTGWSLEQLTELTDKHDIPVHPAAKENGLTNAINRYFDEMEKERDLDGPITGNSGEGNQSTGNS